MTDHDQPDGTAPEEARQGEPAKRRRGHGPHTIKSLGLNMEAGEGGRYWALLPGRLGENKETVYPLPSTVEELALVAALKVTSRSKDPGAIYIRRAKRALAKEKTRLQAVDLTKATRRVTELKDTVRLEAERAREAMATAVSEVRTEALRTVRSMGDLNELLKAGAYMIAEAFVQGKEVNGQPVTVREFTDLTGKGWTHVARLGADVIDPTGKAQSEHEVMAEFNQATRDRLAKELEKKEGVH